MKWSPQQDAALRAVGDWLADASAPQVFRLFGYAGTGKTTLAKHLAEQHNGHVHFAAFTGKAALVLRRKGCGEATTIHSLLYLPSPKSKESLIALQQELAAAAPDDHDERTRLARAIAEEQERLRQPAFSVRPDPLLLPNGKHINLIVVDEVSMVDERVGRDLESTGARILVLGDPAQLPPVHGGGYFTEHAPDVLLTEVHRQALDSPVLALATRVREGARLTPGQYGDSRVCDRGDLSPDEYASTQQLLVGYNKTRTAANRRLRQMAGISGALPNAGEKLVCLRNDHAPNRRLLNGSLWEVVSAADNPGRDDFKLCVRSLDEETNREVDTLCHKYTFMGSAQPDWQDLRYCECALNDYELPECARGCRSPRINEFDFGYALTVHKSQGSQWDDVIVINEWNGSDRTRWLYTAISRAAERITVAM